MPVSLPQIGMGIIRPHAVNFVPDRDLHRFVFLRTTAFLIPPPLKFGLETRRPCFSLRRPVGRPKENPLARPYLYKDLYYGLPVR